MKKIILKNILIISIVVGLVLVLPAILFVFQRSQKISTQAQTIPLCTTPIKNLGTLVDFYEQSGGQRLTTYAMTDPKLNKITGAVNRTTADLWTGSFSAEAYDYYISNADGTANPNGAYVTAHMTTDPAVTRVSIDAGNNMDAFVIRNSATSLPARIVASYQLGVGQPLVTAGLNQALGLPNGFPNNTYVGDPVSRITVGFCTTQQPPFCGNSVVETGEQCDDGNSVSGDGCSSTCQTQTASPSPSPLPSASPSPSPSPLPTVQCQLIKAYRVTGSTTIAASWQLLTTTQLSQLRSGETIYFTALGNSSTQTSISQARIRMTVGTSILLAYSSTDGTTSLKPKSVSTEVNEYYKAFTVPTGAFHMDAQVYSPQLDDDTNPWNSNNGWK